MAIQSLKRLKDHAPFAAIGWSIWLALLINIFFSLSYCQNHKKIKKLNLSKRRFLLALKNQRILRINSEYFAVSSVFLETNLILLNNECNFKHLVPADYVIIPLFTFCFSEAFYTKPIRSGVWNIIFFVLTSEIILNLVLTCEIYVILIKTIELFFGISFWRVKWFSLVLASEIFFITRFSFFRFNGWIKKISSAKDTISFDEIVSCPHEILCREDEIVSHTHEILSRPQEIVSRVDEIVSRPMSY